MIESMNIYESQIWLQEGIKKLAAVKVLRRTYYDVTLICAKNFTNMTHHQSDKAACIAQHSDAKFRKKRCKFKVFMLRQQ